MTFMDTLRVGRSLDEAATLGPLISEAQLEKVLSYIEVGQDAGAELIRGGERLGGDLSSGYFVKPAVFGGVTNQMRIAREEIFGPVLSILPFDDVDEAVAIANDSEYGLGGAVWAQNLSTALRAVRGVHTGTMWVNCYGHIDPMIGFGGTKMSGYGSKEAPLTWTPTSTPRASTSRSDPGTHAARDRRPARPLLRMRLAADECVAGVPYCGISFGCD